MTSDSNILFYDPSESSIGIWSMGGGEPIAKIQVDKVPIRIYSTPLNKRYFIAYEDGTIEVRGTVNFAEVKFEIENCDYVIDMISDDKTFLVVSSATSIDEKEGKVTYIDFSKIDDEDDDYQSDEYGEEDSNQDEKKLIRADLSLPGNAKVTSFKMSSDCITLIGF